MLTPSRKIRKQYMNGCKYTIPVRVSTKFTDLPRDYISTHERTF